MNISAKDFEITILDADHFYVNEFLVDLPSILYQIQKCPDGKICHGISTSFGNIVRRIEYAVKYDTEVNKSPIISYLLDLAQKRIKGTPFKPDGTLI